MAQAIAKDLRRGKRVLVVVGTTKDAEEYFARVSALGGRGQVLVLCASENNGSDWKRHRFDALHVDDGAQAFPAFADLVQEASERCAKSPAPMPRGGLRLRLERLKARR